MKTINIARKASRAFIQGMTFSGTSVVVLTSPARAFERDKAAIGGDWKVVGDDIRKAIKTEQQKIR